MNRASGFTIVELLVVIGVIAVLLALGGGAAVGVAREARTQHCGSNLRQLALATFSYQNQARGQLPPAILYKVRGSELVTEAWDFTQTPDGEVTPGVLWDFADGADSIHQCPDFQGASTFGADPHTGYNYNTTYLAAEGSMPQLAADGRILDGWDAARRGLPPAAHRHTDRCALFGDAGWRGGANKFMRAPSNRVENDLAKVYAGGQAFRHRAGCCNVVHLDGHCARYDTPEAGDLANDELLEGFMAFPRNGFLSADDLRYDPR